MCYRELKSRTINRYVDPESTYIMYLYCLIINEQMSLVVLVDSGTKHARSSSFVGTAKQHPSSIP